MSRNFELLQQAMKNQEQLADDVVAKAVKVAHFLGAEKTQDLLRSTSRLEMTTDNEISPDQSPGKRMKPIVRAVERLRIGLHFWHGRLAQLPLQCRRHLRRCSAFVRQIWAYLSRNRAGRKSILAQVELSREEETKLVQRLFLLPGTASPHTVVFLGVEQGNGCSWVCARAAETLAAQRVGSVCVVDANMRSPSLHQYFGILNGKGLAEAVFQRGSLRKYTKQLPAENLWLLTSGSLISDPHALLSSDGLRSRIEELRATFDYVLIDAPPVNSYTDATLLGRFADGVVLVVEADATRREAAQKAKESLEDAGLRLLAAVLNKRTFPIPETIYQKL